MSYETQLLHSPRRILRRSEVEKLVGFKRAHLYALMKAGQFPKPARIGVRAVGWNSHDIEQWIAQRLGSQTDEPSF